MTYVTIHDYHEVMKSIGTANLKSRLSEHLRAVRGGEVLTILDRNQPIARIVPITDERSELVVRPSRWLLSEFQIPAPLPEGEDILHDLLSEREERS